MTQTITLIEGDGIGPEITAQVVRVLQALQLPLTFDRQTLGQTALEQTGSLIPEEMCIRDRFSAGNGTNRRRRPSCRWLRPGHG